MGNKQGVVAALVAASLGVAAVSTGVATARETFIDLKLERERSEIIENYLNTRANDMEIEAYEQTGDTGFFFDREVKDQVGELDNEITKSKDSMALNLIGTAACSMLSMSAGVVALVGRDDGKDNDGPTE